MVVAKKQSKGRGKPGSVWYSPEGGLYFSVIMKIKDLDMPQITVLTAQSIANVIKREYGIQPEIKKPNDILVDNKKVCGILAEKTKKSLIIGVGINLNIKDFPEGLNAASLPADKKIDYLGFLKSVLAEMKNDIIKQC
ncbi:MAG: BirA family transcriptional regulator biotin operon repressor / biotin-acetyl-CoA-carboxylase ligase [Candidatus Saganbacteria bacterium]|uniref:BirA family transcriptional regulator biotin operon repressor / biotin-acetyl-CoA-carboxylase ligase n=1 Tax=Candidatus Saganbacteria bacterium TaxID=2575572 RepID=A0A833NWR3_UNCSA|nr:MAG: BirA family transcriptional regulator biotin operon repressor / biotin-acetyl-CoA-carboxylase ligase [Candidatus Saganbacteria bacterium]